jgi:5,6-dimethylbenzimidazole synthase
VRHFRPEPIAPQLLADLLATADLAPSVGLSQPWRFVTVDDPARRAAIRANFETANAAALAGQCAERAQLYASLKLAGLDQAPSHLALFAEPEPSQGHGLGRASMPETLAYSAVMALYNVWLSARAVGLGLGWVSILDPAAVATTLDVPANWQFIGYFCLGTPQETASTPELERLGWETRRASVPLRR